MPFVKLDCGILNSTLWLEREAREVFITALLMAEPFETLTPLPQIAIGSLEFTGWSVPPGWYGFVPAASVGIIHRAKVPDDTGLAALARLGEPEEGSRSKDFDGRRLVRVDGGFIVLNYMKYRERDYTAAERQKRYRKRMALRRNEAASRRNITQAEVEVEVDTKANTKKEPVRALACAEDVGFVRWWTAYPKKKSKGAAMKAWAKIRPDAAIVDRMIDALRWQVNQPDWLKDGGQFIPYPATYLSARGWEDEPFHAPNLSEKSVRMLQTVTGKGGI